MRFSHNNVCIFFGHIFYLGKHASSEEMKHKRSCSKNDVLTILLCLNMLSDEEKDYLKKVMLIEETDND